MSSITGEIGYKVGAAAAAIPFAGTRFVLGTLSITGKLAVVGTATIDGSLIIAPTGTGSAALTVTGNGNSKPGAVFNGFSSSLVGGAYAVQINSGNQTGFEKGLQVAAGANASDVAIQVANLAQSVLMMEIFGDASGHIGAAAANRGATWGTNGNFSFSTTAAGGIPVTLLSAAGTSVFLAKLQNVQAMLVSAVDGATVLGTSTAYAWGTGTNYPMLQFAGVGAIFGTATTGIVLTGGGLYYSGTHYVYGQGGTGVVASLGTGTFSIAISTAGTAAQVADPVTIVKVDSLGMVIGTMTNTTAGGFNAPAIFANGTQITGAGASVANPTAKVSTTATNGVSASAMRADGAPAIDSAMTPTWTGTHVFSPAANTPITVTGTMTNGTGIFVNMTSSGTGQQIQGIVVVNTIGSNNNLWVTITNTSVSAANVAGLSLVGGTSTFNNTDFELYQQGDQVAVLYNGAAKPMDFFVGGVNVLQLNTATTPVIKGYGPTAVGLVDMTPDTGRFVGTYIGGTATVNGTAIWSRNGNQVMIQIPGINPMASNSTSYTFAPLPAAITPTNSLFVQVPDQVFEDNSAIINNVLLRVNTTGTLVFYKSGQSTTSWTASGNKYPTATFVIQYPLN